MADKLKVDDSLIRQLAKLLEETGLKEIEIGEGAQHVRVARDSAGAAVGQGPAPVRALVPAPAGGDGEARSGEIEASHPGAVTSPMVGTLYVAPEPGAPPFVVPGASVREGETMFIIEAMKTMNPVRAPRGGKVVRVLAHNEAPVEYGEVLALIE
jgi:acetyl-CoA carboxylase biotin carboxyl carrier protein